MSQDAGLIVPDITKGGRTFWRALVGLYGLCIIEKIIIASVLDLLVKGRPRRTQPLL